MKGDSDIYRALQWRIDRLPVPFPQTSSGVEIRLLKYLFNPEEAAVACELSASREPVSKINKRLAKKGFTYSNRELKTLLNCLQIDLPPKILGGQEVLTMNS